MLKLVPPSCDSILGAKSGDLSPGQTALELLAGAEHGATIAILAADSGLKYLSTDLYG